MDQPKFICKKCGKCCRNMRGRTYKEQHKFPPIVFFTVPPSLMTIGLFEWETPILRRKAKELSISLQLKPSFISWEQESQKAIATMWNLDHDNCPFLSEDNSCRIYADRPLVCQTYPLMAIGILDQERKTPLRLSVGDCPNAVDPFQKGYLCMPTSYVFKELTKVYGSTFLGALRNDLARILLSTYLNEASMQGHIRSTIIDKNIIKAILRSKPVGLFEFLKSKSAIDEKNLQQQIQTIYSLNMKELEKKLN